ncbi:MAG: outer membrane protein [Planctomycetota bacterium]|jgi:outer membrane protein
MSQTVGIRPLCLLILGVLLLMLSPVYGQVKATGAKTGSSQAQDTSKKRSAKKLTIGVDEAVKLATTYNSSLRVAYYNHLIDRTSVSEAEAIFEPTLNLAANYGADEGVFPSIFPTGQLNPDGTPQFFQAIVTDSSDVGGFSAGVKGLFPTGATYEMQIRSNYRNNARGGLINPSFQTSTSVAFTQPILRNAWMQYNYANIRLARYAESQSRQRYRRDVLSTIQAVHTAYWNYVFSIKDLTVKRRSLELANKLLEINRVKVETGVFAPIEIASAESGVATRVTDVLIAENEIENNADQLRRLIMTFKDREEWDIQIIPSDDIAEVTFDTPNLDECIDIALSERPDLAESRLSLRTQDINLAVADNELLPRVDVVASVNFTGLNTAVGNSFLDSYGVVGAETWNLGVTLEIPLGNRAARARISRTRLQRNQALMAYRDLQLTAVEEVRRAYRDVEIADKTSHSQKKAMELKLEELKNERIKLDNKVSTNFQVLEIESDLANAKSEFIRALVQYRIALSSLANAMGSSQRVLKWAPRR